MADFGTQFSLFDSTPLSGKDTCLYWGELEGEDADAAPVALAKALTEAPAVVPHPPDGPPWPGHGLAGPRAG